MSCELRVASCELQVASCELRVARCELRVASCELRVASWSCDLRVANWSCKLRAACTVGVANYQLRVYMTRCELEMLVTSLLVPILLVESSSRPDNSLPRGLRGFSRMEEKHLFQQREFLGLLL